MSPGVSRKLTAYFDWAGELQQDGLVGEDILGGFADIEELLVGEDGGGWGTIGLGLFG